MLLYTLSRDYWPCLRLAASRPQHACPLLFFFFYLTDCNVIGTPYSVQPRQVGQTMGHLRAEFLATFPLSTNIGCQGVISIDDTRSWAREMKVVEIVLVTVSGCGASRKWRSGPEATARAAVRCGGAGS